MKNCVQSAVMEGSRQLKESKNALLIIGGCPWYITVGPSYLQGNLQSLLPLISSLYHIPYDCSLEANCGLQKSTISLALIIVLSS
ncbi:uncharacterized protein LOC108227501 isoform X2 [Daucus carota subsp. sativus]|uniref:uncharacterized protein LOC108227501 isoform X2 n=1 Tax=Daucus carota subsp. sativus TaxID=79200 RepID=UPI003082D01D